MDRGVRVDAGAEDPFAAPLPNVFNDGKEEPPRALSEDKAAAALSKLVISGGASSNAAESAFDRLMSGENKPNAALGDGNVTSLHMMTPMEKEDVLAHGFSSGDIAILTWFMHTTRVPAYNSSEFRYGVDPSSVRKLYAGLQSSAGTLLWELVKSNISTMRDFQDHFHRAVQAASDYPAIKLRLSSHWIEMTQYFDSVELVRSYYKKFLTVRSGRGLPKLVDESILMLVLCAELESARQGSSGGDLRLEMQSLVSMVKEQTRTVEAGKETISDLKVKLGEVKNDLNNMKNDIKTLKEKASNAKASGALKDRQCTYCKGVGHTEPYCHSKMQDDAAKKAKGED